MQVQVLSDENAGDGDYPLPYVILEASPDTLAVMRGPSRSYPGSMVNEAFQAGGFWIPDNRSMMLLEFEFIHSDFRDDVGGECKSKCCRMRMQIPVT